VTTHEISTAQPSGLAELKQAHRRTWASGSYASVAERIVDDVPPRHLLERLGIEPGMEVLDLATGTGNVAIRAAQLGARVTGVDLTPELFGRRASAPPPRASRWSGSPGTPRTCRSRTTASTWSSRRSASSSPLAMTSRPARPSG
jgi:SAM-dependent methyltransferase